jgi:fatty acid-binding protein DegV
MAYDGKVFISNSECLPDAQAVGGKIEGLFDKMDGSVEYFPIGATIGTHTGPGTVALFYWGARRA